MGYREFAPPAALGDLVECAWVVDGPPAPVRVLPDGCMDLIRMDGRVIGRRTRHRRSVSPREGEPFVGLRFRPGVLPRLLGVPASELRNDRVPLHDLRAVPRRGSLADLAAALLVERTAAAKPRPGRCRC